ncbi:MAG: hypothetical protein ABII18_12295 [bacterium]|nr:hypothetical protein [bacterium]MBU1918575.1 hypothetical protein [bacterium]
MKKYFVIAIIATTLLQISCQTGPLNSDTTIIPDDATVVEETISNLETKKTYYWKIVAEDSNGNSAESETWSFETE